MTFEEILDQTIAMLQRRGRLSYGTLKRQFQVDDAALDDWKNELIKGQRLAVDEDGIVLVWTGDASTAPPTSTPPARPADRAPLTYTPPHLQVSYFLGLLYWAIGDFVRAAELLRRNVEAVDRESDTSSTGIQCRAWLARTLSPLGAFAEGRRHGEEAISESIHTGALLGHAVRLVWLSEVSRLEGQGEEAWQHAHQALDLARQQKAHGDEALALYQLGTVQAHTVAPDAAQAEAHYRQALALAEELGMRPLQAHCHRGLGTLYAATGQREQARTELAAAIALYRAMDMTFWLPQAEAALAQVGGGAHIKAG